MRDGPSGRSRGFGFLTFKDPRTVNVVMVKEHFLDGKIVRALISTSPNAPGRQQQPPSRPFSHPPTRSQDPQHERELTNLKIDPKRAIPRDEQERTSKIFVGGVSQEANEQDFKDYFSQFGRVIDATLMIDKITHRPRGFGFVTFDSEAAVELTLQGDLMLKDKPIEVKKAQPRGNMREEEDMNDRRGGRRGGGGGGGGGGKDFNDRGNYDNGANQNQNQGQQYPQGPAMTPQMMAQYWTKMQQYFAVAQQQMAAMQGSAMNPAMMAQMQQYKQMQAMQAMQAQMAQQQQQPQRGSASPMPPQSPGAQGGMNPMMMQQMQQMQAMAAQGGGYGMSMSPQGFNPGNGGGGGGGGGGAGSPHHPPGSRGTPGYNAQDQLAFEQQKYEQQQARRAQQEAQQMQSYAQGGGGPTSWEGMYDDVPQPGGQGGYGGRGGGRGGGGGGGGGAGGFQKTTPGPQSAPPANAPTGPKNAGKPGANYRGGAGGRGGHRGGYHPYAR